MQGSSEWKAALRLQIEALARRNDLHRRCGRSSAKTRTQEMDIQIIKLRELLAVDANKCAQFYLECVCHADETERILNRTSSRKKRKKIVNGTKEISTESSVPTIVSVPSTSAPLAPPSTLPADKDNSQDRVPHDKRWWEQLHIHRREEYYAEGKYEVRQMWKTQRDFFLSCLGLIIGVGHFIRFPASIYEYGGGVFFVPYIVCHVFLGLPLLYIQFVLGQFSGLGAHAALKKMAPIATGLGWALVFSGFPFAVYFNMYVVWCIHYMAKSAGSVFTGSTAWEECTTASHLYVGRTCCSLDKLVVCDTSNGSVMSSEAYFFSNVGIVSSSLQFDISSISSSILIYLFFAWLLAMLGSLKTIQSSGFSTTIAVTTPYLLMCVLFLRGISLQGSNEGLSYLLSVDISKIFTKGIWRAASRQVFFELGLSSAPMMTFAALSRFRNNIYRDAVILISISVVTSLFCALIVFAFAGYYASRLHIPVEHLIALDPHFLSFFIFPSMTSTLKGGEIWAILFFATLTLTTVDAQFGIMEMLASAVMTQLSSKNRHLERKLIVLFCVLGFLLAIPFCANGGILLFRALDTTIAGGVTCVLSLFVVLLVSQVYGTDDFLNDIAYMIRIPILPMNRWSQMNFSSKLQSIFGPTGLFIKYSLNLFVPILLILLLLLHVIDYKRISFANLPVSWQIEAFAWITAFTPLLFIPFYTVKLMVDARRTGKTWQSLFDTSMWTQLEDDIPMDQSNGGPMNSQKRRRTALRENTYMYIDPITRLNTVQSAVFNVEENYGWRVGRLKEVQDDPVLRISTSVNSFHGSQSSVNNGELNLFGSPPVSNAFMLTDVISKRNKVLQRSSRTTSQPSESSDDNAFEMPEVPKISCVSDPPHMRMPSPVERVSPSRSEPPMSNGHMIKARSKSDDDYSDDSDDQTGFGRQRPTVIRRLPSEDLQSMSITPVDLPRERSLSSVAIFDKDNEPRSRQTLSQLKRPAPIHVPPSNTRF